MSHISTRACGRSARSLPDKQVIIATKFGFDLSGGDTRPGAPGLNSRPEHIKQAVDGSLKRLGSM